MKRRERLLAECAHHEAGHAVVSWVLHRKFRRVTIKPEEGSLGYVLKHRTRLTETSGEDALLLHAIRDSIIGYAGQIAQQEYKGKPATFNRRNSNAGWQSDNEGADDMAVNWLGYSFETLDTFQRYTFVRAQAIVAHQWASIQNVAQSLLERETITYEEILEVIMPGATALRQSLKEVAAAMKATKQKGK